MGTPPAADGGGRDAEEDEIPVAVFGREPAGVAGGEVRRPARVAPEDRPGLGDQGIVAGPVGVPAPGLGAAALEALVLLGDAFAPEAGHQGGEDGPRASGERL